MPRALSVPASPHVANRDAYTRIGPRAVAPAPSPARRARYPEGVRQRRQPEGETFSINVPFPLTQPDLLMAEGPRQWALRV
jgi:hypothetical protein